MDADSYQQLRGQALRLVRQRQDAEDLVQETLLIGWQAGRADLPWLSGVLRNQARLVARGASRRRQRELLAAPAEDHSEPVPAPPSTQWLQALPRAPRRVAVLALHGLGAEEIRWILGIGPTAFRQRLTSIRRHLGALPAELHAEGVALAYLRDPARSADLPFGLVRRALKAALQRVDGLGSHDADGHLLVIRPRAHTLADGGN
ncbi:RNA polymerase sigma factor [Pseudoxanthomonas wuyuanensis]